MPTAPYNLYMAVPAYPTYSENPTCFSDLTFAVATQTGATLHANIAVSSDPLYVDPIAALPLDQCWGHPIFDQYHYHGYSWKCFPNQGDENQHSPLFGYALDGFGVFGPRGDGGVLLTNEDLDVCHGHSGKIDWDGILTDMYHYHLNNEYPYGPGCFRGYANRCLFQQWGSFTATFARERAWAGSVPGRPGRTSLEPPPEETVRFNLPKFTIGAESGRPPLPPAGDLLPSSWPHPGCWSRGSPGRKTPKH